MRTLGNKVAARHAAVAAGVAVMPATPPLPYDVDECASLAAGIGFPVMLKASWGGGGRGMRVIESAAELPAALEASRREALAAFGNDEVYFEKLIRRARHVEVQILGDQHGNLVHLHERDCTVQRRNQKVVERAPAPYMDAAGRAALCGSALELMRSVGYTHAGTVEFLMDADDGKCYFIEVNPRIQVEHTVTEMITGVDIVKAQIRITEGGFIGVTHDSGDGRLATGVPEQAKIPLNGHALQCRVTTEDPENGFLPDYGRLAAYRSAAGFGIRLDAGTAYGGAVITPYYDSLLVKVTAWAPTATETIARMDRALREFRIRGVATNLQFLENLINHPAFVDDTEERADDALHREHARAAGLCRAPRPCQQDAALPGRGGGARQSRGGRAHAAGAAFAEAGAAGHRSGSAGARRHAPAAAGAGPGRLCAMDAGAEAGAGHRHHHARRAPVAAGHAHAHRRPAADRAVLRA